MKLHRRDPSVVHIPQKIEGTLRRERRRKKELLRALKVFALSLSVILLLTGCVTQAEIDAVRGQEYPNAAVTPVPELEPGQPGEPLEGGESGELGESSTPTNVEEEDAQSGGLLDQLLGMFGSRNTTLQIVALLTVLSLAPSILIMLTSFVRIIMILSFTRNAMGLQQMPPNQVMVGLALFLTLFVMWPVFEEIKTEAYIPYVAEVIEIEEAVERGVRPIRKFMVERTRDSDLGMFYSFSDIPEEEIPTTFDGLIEETPMRIAIPAFLTSELRRAFEIGFFIYLPFIVIDMIVSSTLLAMGMMMLPPIVISLPFKILLFVLVDGWALTFRTIISSFAG